MAAKYNSSINVMGSIPDFAPMIDSIKDEITSQSLNDSIFMFRTEKTLYRFQKAINDSILQFANAEHLNIFAKAIQNEGFSYKDKLLILFWQMTFANSLFNRISADVFMNAIYSGRVSLMSDEILSLLHHIHEVEPGEITWSEATVKITASKYLTLLKKLGLAEGGTRKEIIHPSISSELFVFFIKLALIVYPETKKLDNEMMQFSFLDRESLIQRLKRIEFLPYWNISQIGDNVTIELKDNES